MSGEAINHNTCGVRLYLNFIKPFCPPLYILLPFTSEGATPGALGQRNQSLWWNLRCYVTCGRCGSCREIALNPWSCGSWKTSSSSTAHPASSRHGRICLSMTHGGTEERLESIHSRGFLWLLKERLSCSAGSEHRSQNKRPHGKCLQAQLMPLLFTCSTCTKVSECFPRLQFCFSRQLVGNFERKGIQTLLRRKQE